MKYSTISHFFIATSVSLTLVFVGCDQEDSRPPDMSARTSCKRSRPPSEGEVIDEQTPDEVKSIHVICDNISIHKGKLVRQWLQRHPRFEMHHTPVHCSWMNQVEQWFSILRRKRLAAPNFADLGDLAAKLEQFVDEWNEIAQPFQWTSSSFSKILEKLEVGIARSQAA